MPNVELRVLRFWIFNVFLIISHVETFCFYMGNILFLYRKQNINISSVGLTQRFRDLSGAGSAGIFIIRNQVTACLPM